MNNLISMIVNTNIKCSTDIQHKCKYLYRLSSSKRYCRDKDKFSQIAVYRGFNLCFHHDIMRGPLPPHLYPYNFVRKFWCLPVS